MKRKTLLAAALSVLLLILPGCVALIIGAAGVAGGVAISEDEIEGVMEKSFDQIYKSSRQVLLNEGVIKLEDRPHGIMEGEVGKTEVKVTVNQLTDKTVRLRVKARKGYKVIPDLETANRLYNKIFEKLK